MIWLAESSPEFNKTINMDEQTRDLILAGLDNVEFKVEHTNPQRGLKRLQQEPNICVGDKIYNPERQRFSLSSELPQVVVPGLRLYLRKDAMPDTGIDNLNNTQLSFSQIMQHAPQLQLGVMRERSYGIELDKVLDMPKWRARIWRRSGTDMGAGLVAMLMNGRVGGIFEYPNVFKHYSQKFTDHPPVVSLTIQETSDYFVGYVLCSRSEAGRQAIDAISTRIQTLSHQREYLDVHLQWFDASIHKDIIGYYNEVYDTTFSLSHAQ